MKGKNLRIITEILAIIAICLISFVGVFKQNANIMENKVKKYNIGKDLTGYRELICTVSDATQVANSEGKIVGNTDTYSDNDIESYSYQKKDTKVNPDEELKIENYEKAKSIIEDRLKKFGVQEYNLSLNTENGTISLQIPEDDTTDHTISNILQVSNFKIKDSEDESKVFLTNNDLKNVQAMYNTTETGTTVYLQMELNENGKKILKDITSNEYAKKPEDTTKNEEEQDQDQEDENAVEAETEVSTDENKEENSNESSEENVEENKDESSEENKEENSDTEKEEDKQKEISLTIDNNDMVTTSFEEPIENGIINLTMGTPSTDAEEISNTLHSTSTIATLLNCGNMPLTYKFISNQYVSSNLSDNNLKQFIEGIAIAIGVILIFFILKYKLKGIIVAISFIGFIAIDLLLIRYTNVSIMFESIVAGIIVLVINYLLVYRLLQIKETDKEAKKEAYNNEIKSWIIKLLPMFIISIVFVFIRRNEIADFGMFIFWGILLSVIYNALLTKDMINQINK